MNLGQTTHFPNSAQGSRSHISGFIIFMQPATVTNTVLIASNPLVNIPSQTQMMQGYCATGMPLSK